MEKVSSFLGSIIRPQPSAATPDATVASIFLYPIKSCRGISVPQASITATGFRWDREWVIVNSKGRAYTQRNEPKLALIEAELPQEAMFENWMPTDDSYLVLKAPGMDTLRIRLDKPCEKIDEVSVWEWSGSAYDEGQEASDWLTNYIGKPSRLVRFNTESETRIVDPDYAPGHKTTFSDGFPFMVISQGSLDALNKLLEEPLPINRFRPNIFVAGCDPFAEDLWKELKINQLMFTGVKLCARCKVPTINQENGIAGIEPTETLTKFRSDNVLRQIDKPHGKVYFGQNLVCKESQAQRTGRVVKVGDPVVVLQKFPSFADAPA